jgi:hypothetical protein
MTYQVTGSFGALSEQDLKDLCLADGPSGASWDSYLGVCKNMSIATQQEICRRSGGQWDFSLQMCSCPPNFDTVDLDATFVGCSGGVSPGQSSSVTRMRVSRTTPKISAVKSSAAAPPRANVSRNQNAIPEPVVGMDSSLPWPWIIGGVAVVSLVGVGLFVTRK